MGMGIARIAKAVSEMEIDDHVFEGVYPSLSDIPDDLLARALNYLDAPSLSKAEWACRRFRRIVLEHDLWREQCLNACPQLRSFHADLLIKELKTPRASPMLALEQMLLSPPPEEVLRAAAFYKLHSELTAPDSNHSLLACALSASSTDNPEESVENVLTPLHRFNPALGVRSGSYWSSRGSEDESSSEWLALRLAHPLCLVSAVSIMPFLAFFQRGHPIYAPKAARFVFSCGEDVKARPVGSTPDSDTDEDPETDALLEEAEEAGYATIRSCARFSAWETRTEAFPMSQSDELQMFEFKRPILCVGGLVKIELLGRTQRQEQDNAWYTCINHVRVLGKPLHNFAETPAQTQDPAEASSSSAPKRCPQQGVKIEGVPLVLEARREDPMVARGGLMALSEGGLLLQRLATEAQGEGTADYDTDDELIDADVIGPHLAEIGLEFEWLAGGQPMPPWIAHPPQPPQQQQAPADGED